MCTEPANRPTASPYMPVISLFLRSESLSLTTAQKRTISTGMILGSGHSFFLNFVRMFFGLLFSLPQGRNETFVLQARIRKLAQRSERPKSLRLLRFALASVAITNW